MKLSLRLLLLLPFIFVIVGCPGTDDPPVTEARPYLDVYNEDLAEIEDFMDTHFMTVDGDYNVAFTEITSSTPGTPISSHPALDFKTINKGGVDHKLYFIKLNEGIGGSNGDLQPTKLDSVLTTYKGYKTDLTIFDSKSNVDDWFQMENVIQGWQEVFPNFKSGDDAVIQNNDGTFSFTNFGAGIMFIPSGLGYFNQLVGDLSAYTPLIFTFKLLKVKFRDHDGDKILSKDEYGGPTSGTALDSDGDGKPDYADFDDDNDGILTKEEIRITPGTSSWYSFGTIPTCSGGGNGKKKHLDPFCH
jgi:FKBP-type peptidyl-prolyl cis-trans isomerase FkpA